MPTKKQTATDLKNVENGTSNFSQYANVARKAIKVNKLSKETDTGPMVGLGASVPGIGNYLGAGLSKSDNKKIASMKKQTGDLLTSLVGMESNSVARTKFGQELLTRPKEGVDQNQADNIAGSKEKIDIAIRAMDKEIDRVRRGGGSPLMVKKMILERDDILKEMSMATDTKKDTSAPQSPPVDKTALISSLEADEAELARLESEG